MRERDTVTEIEDDREREKVLKDANKEKGKNRINKREREMEITSSWKE